MNNYILFLITLFCWSPTWYLIKFQLGYVDPLVSVFYRFLIAAIIFLSFINACAGYKQIYTTSLQFEIADYSLKNNEKLGKKKMNLIDQ